MKCEICHQREASVAYTHIVDNDKKTAFLCSACSPQQKSTAGKEASATADTPVMAKKMKAELKKPDQTEGAATTLCPHCGMSYEEFRKGGRFGCQACYEAFDGQLERLMKRIHGAVRHQGKGLVTQRRAIPSDEELKELRRDLESAVAAEEYEKAAELRDRIMELETGLSDDEAERR